MPLSAGPLSQPHQPGGVKGLSLAIRRQRLPGSRKQDEPPAHPAGLEPLGDSLMPAVNAVKTWAEAHIDQIEASRAAHDQKAASE
jgi:hypothetical protein